MPEQDGGIRPISITFEGLARVDGSARFSFGSTSALASVSGPIEVRLNSENPSQATFEVSVRPLSSIAGIDSKSLGSTIKSLLSPSIQLSVNPRTLIQVVIQALSPSSTIEGAKWDDGLVSAMINASTLALLNAGSIPMRGVVCAVAVGLKSSGIVIDPPPEEYSDVSGGGCFAFLFGHGVGARPNDADNVCVWSSWSGDFGDKEEETFLAVREAAKLACRKIWEEMKRSIAQREGGLTTDEDMVVN
ncbi:hypothetical protein ONZ45_g9611 [Pleurotus djamor]|nr:hypothetical protein ONZ45_g9611 [Pleurotus djamor]